MVALIPKPRMATREMERHEHRPQDAAFPLPQQWTGSKPARIIPRIEGLP